MLGTKIKNEYLKGCREPGDLGHYSEVSPYDEKTLYYYTRQAFKLKWLDRMGVLVTRNFRPMSFIDSDGYTEQRNLVLVTKLDKVSREEYEETVAPQFECLVADLEQYAIDRGYENYNKLEYEMYTFGNSDVRRIYWQVWQCALTQSESCYPLFEDVIRFSLENWHKIEYIHLDDHYKNVLKCPITGKIFIYDMFNWAMRS